VTHRGKPYHYNINMKKRAVVEKEGLDSDEEYVEDLLAMRHIEEILHATYEKKTIGRRSGEEEGSPFHI
jgi:hypothetical protein